ncbi:MAG: acyl-CoA dehydrogenase family protein [Myxococcales bacterium]|nr:acyl-CoA dehydrogenase family protein [Myxococcales bacterium]
MDGEKIISEVMGGGLRVLNRIADSPLVERLGLEDRAQKLVYEGAKRAAETAAKAAKRFRTKRTSDRPRSATKFDLSLSEEQQLMRDTLRRFADDVMQPAAREADDRSAPTDDFLDAFSDLGAIPMAVPEALGGAAEKVSAVSQMLIAEDLARGDMGLAYAVLSPLSFVNALVHWGDDDQRASLLPSFIEGETTAAAVAVVEPQPLFDPSALRTTATKHGSHYVLRGEKSLVAVADRAQWLLVAAEVPKIGPRFFVVERDAAGVEVIDEPAMGLRSAGLGRVTLDKVRVTDDTLLGGEAALGVAGKAAYDDAVDRARVAWGAMAVGTSQALLDYAIPYCNDRIAFGEPISHRQAVAFMIADIGIELESMRMLVYRAAGRLDAGLPCQREAYLARTLCSEKAMQIGTNGVQLLGGAGFIKDHPMEIWYRQLRSIAVMDGNLLL